MAPLSWRVGDVKITRIVELTTASLGPHLLPQATPDRLLPIPWLHPFLDLDGRIILSMHALVVEADDQLIVVDTCIGNDKERAYPRWNQMQTDFLDRFKALGFDPEQVDVVLCTHMHVDHVGWNTHWRDNAWHPTFANARYLYAQQEWAHWQQEQQEYGPVVEDSVQPIFDAGLADLVSPDHQVCPAVRLMPTHGHTPGHVSVGIESRGQTAVITGDMIHHPCQILHPSWASLADVDGEQGIQTRTEFLARYCDSDTLVIGTHFVTPTAGYVVSSNAGYEFSYPQD